MARKQVSDDGKKLRLTVYLIKAGYSAIPDFLDVSKLREVKVNLPGAEGTLYYRSGFESKPPWAKVFENVPAFDARSIINQGSRALYVVKIEDNWLCFTFGYTRHLLEEAAIQRNFGLIVSLNLGDPTAIKAIDKVNISHLGLQSREQVGRDAAFDGFEFNTDVDLLKAITAKGSIKPNEERETYSGRDSVTVYTRVTLETLADIGARLYRAYRSTKYKKSYGWIDNVSEERDAVILKELDDKLVGAINADDLAKVWLAVPEIVSWEEVEGFAYRFRAKIPEKAGPVLHSDIDLDSWLAETKLKGSVTLSRLKNRKIYICYKSDQEPATWSVYRSLNAEIDLRRNKYILNDGAWYNVDRSYVADVDSFYQRIERSSLRLPSFETMDEPGYLKHVAATNARYALMDRKLIAIGGGRSTVEFCDLYSEARDIVHVKQYGGSSLLSHLFSQALVSAECFLFEEPFRKEVNSRLPPRFRTGDAAQAPVAAQYKICIAVMSKVPGPLELPFFSKVSLRNAARTLQRMNFKVSLLKIER